MRRLGIFVLALVMMGSGCRYYSRALDYSPFIRGAQLYRTTDDHCVVILTTQNNQQFMLRGTALTEKGFEQSSGELCNLAEEYMNTRGVAAR